MEKNYPTIKKKAKKDPNMKNGKKLLNNKKVLIFQLLYYLSISALPSLTHSHTEMSNFQRISHESYPPPGTSHLIPY